MAEPKSEEFVPLRFDVALYIGKKDKLLCSGSFSEVSGFELTMEPVAIAEGGQNWGEHQRCGPTKFAPIILKRGVTSINDLWDWFDVTTRQGAYSTRLHGEITVFGSSTAKIKGEPGKGVHAGQEVTRNPIMVWTLSGVLPVKFKGPDLNATANQVAIEELHLVHEGLELKRPA